MTEILEIIYRYGMIRGNVEIGRLPGKKWTQPEIPAEITGAIRDNAILKLPGIHGDAAAGDPVEYDYLKITLPEKVVEIVVFNRGIGIMHTASEEAVRLHRALCILKMAESGISLGAGPSAAKTERNAPCPCGSGKKYKKCCLNKPGSGASGPASDLKE